MPHPEFDVPGSRPAPAHTPGDELRLLEYLDGQLPAEAARALEEHLGACPACQELRRQWQQLEAPLVERSARAALSADFTARLWERIERESPAPLAEASRAQRRAQLEAEFQAARAGFRKHFLRTQWPALLDWLGYGVGSALCGYALLRFWPQLLGWAGQVAPAALNQSVSPLALAVSALALVAGLALAAKKPIARWLEAL